MADQLQLRRGTTSQMLTFTGAQGEATVDTDKNALVLHDGVTAGGYYQATSAQLRDGTFYYNEDAGSASDAYILTPKANTNLPSSYMDGIQFGFVTTHPNTGASTANFQGLGVKNLKFPGGVDPLAGEINGRVYVIYDAANGWLEIQRKASGPPPQLRSVSASVASSALTARLDPCTIDFRATSLGSGVVNTRNVSSTISVVVPNGATLGTTNGASSRLVILAIYGPSNVELAIVNLTGSGSLDETTLINTTAISVGSNSANVAYSTVARANVPYRVVGFVDSAQATAGAWNTAPTIIQGAGGQAVVSLASLGYFQTWTDVTGSRVLSTTYTNSTGKPIFVLITFVSVNAAGYSQISVNGVPLHNTSASTGTTQFVSTGIILVPPGAGYNAVTAGGGVTINRWMELR